MPFQNIINAVVILAAVAMARPQTPGQARQSLSLKSRQDIGLDKLNEVDRKTSPYLALALMVKAEGPKFVPCHISNKLDFALHRDSGVASR